MDYLIPTEDDPPNNVEEAHHMIKFHTKIFVLLTSLQLVAVLANQPFVALNIIFCLYMVSYQIWRCIVLINDHFALRPVVDSDEDDEDEEGEEGEGEEGEGEEGEGEGEADADEEGEDEEGEEGEDEAEEGCECEEGECKEGECEEGGCEEGVCECDEQEDAQHLATNGELADDEGTAPMEVVDEVEDTEEVEPTQDVVAAEPILQSDEVKPKARRRRRQD
jgi:hypothetical protein